MSLAGLGVVAIWHDLLPEAKDAFYQWHNREHMPERTDIPGFHRGRRYIATSGGPEYFNLYEADDLAVLAGADYLDRLNNPTAWTREVVASFRNVSRGICRVLYSAGVGQGGAIATLRFAVDETSAENVQAALCRDMLPAIEQLSGLSGAHLCRTDEAVSRIETAEKKAREEGTRIPDWVLLIEGVDREIVCGAASTVRDKLSTLGAGDFHLASYRLEHQRCKQASGANNGWIPAAARLG